MAGNHDSPQAWIVEGDGRRWRGVQFVERRVAGALPSTITREPRGISGSGGNGSAGMMGEETAME
jgi:hypothetical protein